MQSPDLSGSLTCSRVPILPLQADLILSLVLPGEINASKGFMAVAVPRVSVPQWWVALADRDQPDLRNCAVLQTARRQTSGSGLLGRWRLQRSGRHERY